MTHRLAERLTDGTKLKYWTYLKTNKITDRTKYKLTYRQNFRIIIKTDGLTDRWTEWQRDWEIDWAKQKDIKSNRLMNVLKGRK